MIIHQTNHKGNKMPEEYTFPYLRAWERMMHSSERYTNSRLALAHKENAPHDAMWRSINGKWHCFSEMADHNHNKALIASYVKGIEDE
jgi:hypothetical protein